MDVHQAPHMYKDIQSESKKSWFKGFVNNQKEYEKNNHMSICFVKIPTLLQVFCDISKNAATVIGKYFEKSSVLSIKHSFN